MKASNSLIQSIMPTMGYEDGEFQSDHCSMVSKGDKTSGESYILPKYSMSSASYVIAGMLVPGNLNHYLGDDGKASSSRPAHLIFLPRPDLAAVLSGQQPFSLSGGIENPKHYGWIEYVTNEGKINGREALRRNDKVKVYSRLVDTGETSIGGHADDDYAYFNEVVADARDLDSEKRDILAIYAKRARLLRHLAEQLHLLELGLACLLMSSEQMDEQKNLHRIMARLFLEIQPFFNESVLNHRSHNNLDFFKNIVEDKGLTAGVIQLPFLIKSIAPLVDAVSLNQSNWSEVAADPFSLEQLLEKVKDECGFSDEEFEQCGIEITKTEANGWSANFTKKLPLVCDEKQQLVTLVKQAFEKNKTTNKAASHFSETLKSLLTEKYPDGRGAKYCNILVAANGARETTLQDDKKTRDQMTVDSSPCAKANTFSVEIGYYNNLVNDLLSTIRGSLVGRLFEDGESGPASAQRRQQRERCIDEIASKLLSLHALDSASTSQKTQQAAPAEQRTQCSR